MTACLQVAQLSKLFAALVELAVERLDPLVHDFVSAQIATLGKGPATDIAAVGTLAGVTSFMGLRGSEIVVYSGRVCSPSDCQAVRSADRN